MGACKGCNEIVSSLEINEDGLCKRCVMGEAKPKEITPEEVEEMKKSEEKEIDDTKTFFFIVISLLIVAYIFFGRSNESVEKKYYLKIGETYTTRQNTIGCRNVAKLYEAIRVYRNDGVYGLRPFTEAYGCLWLPQREVEVRELDPYAIKVFYPNPYGKSKTLYVDEDELM